MLTTFRHWAHGGTTALDNLALLCRRHHRLVHDGRVIDNPPVAVEAAGAALIQANTRTGSSINDLTCRSDWDGRVVEYDTAVGGLLTLTPT